MNIDRLINDQDDPDSTVKGEPFRGALPTIRFATGSTFLVLGVAGIVGWSTTYGWLAQGRSGWLPIDLSNAYIFVLFGALMMLSWSRIAREASWLMLVIIGAGALWQGISIGPDAIQASHSHVVRSDPEVPRALICPVSAFLLLVTGIRIFSATRIIYLAPALDGLILGIAASSLIGFLSGYTPLYFSNTIGGISFLETIGFMVLGVMFLLAEFEYARLRSREQRLTGAIAVAAFAAVLSLRVSEALLESYGTGGLNSLALGHFSPLVIALGAMNLLISIAIGVAALVALISRKDTEVAHRESDLRQRIHEDLIITTEQLNSAYNDLANVVQVAGNEMRVPSERLRSASIELISELQSGRFLRAEATALDISGEIQSLERLLKRLARAGNATAMGLTRTELDFSKLVAGTVSNNYSAIAAKGCKVMTARAKGRIYADENLIARVINMLFLRVLERANSDAALISVSLSQYGDSRLISISCGTSGSTSAADDPDEAHNLTFAERVARWHGGRFWITSDGVSTNYNISLPDTDITPDRPV